MSDSRTYPSRPIVAVGGLVLDRNRIVVVQRATEPHKGEWSLPGGLVELGETVKAALIRECREETGLEVRPAEVAAVIDRIIPGPDGRPEFHYVLIDYLCAARPGELKAGSDVSAARWVDRQELMHLPMADFTRELILKFL
jgi:8-oxo-dGTP diphosphatase